MGPVGQNKFGLGRLSSAVYSTGMNWLYVDASTCHPCYVSLARPGGPRDSRLLNGHAKLKCRLTGFMSPRVTAHLGEHT